MLFLQYTVTKRRLSTKRIGSNSPKQGHYRGHLKTTDNKQLDECNQNKESDNQTDEQKTHRKDKSEIGPRREVSIDNHEYEANGQRRETRLSRRGNGDKEKYDDSDRKDIRIENENVFDEEQEEEFESKEVRINNGISITKQQKMLNPRYKDDLLEIVMRKANEWDVMMYVERVKGDIFLLFGKRVQFRGTRNGNLLVRRGGGWNTFDEYMQTHEPKRVSFFF